MSLNLINSMYTILEEQGQPLIVLDTFLAMVVGSIGSAQYRHLYVGDANDRRDVIHDGDVACAYYVSSILHLMNLIDNGVHTYVSYVEADMIDSGWVKIDQPRPGAVVIWEDKQGTDGAKHKHSGICLDENDCVSTSPTERSPQKHGIYDLRHPDGAKRKVESLYFHPTLE